jgi:hypothetical protein
MGPAIAPPGCGFGGVDKRKRASLRSHRIPAMSRDAADLPRMRRGLQRTSL